MCPTRQYHSMYPIMHPSERVDLKKQKNREISFLKFYFSFLSLCFSLQTIIQGLLNGQTAQRESHKTRNHEEHWTPLVQFNHASQPGFNFFIYNTSFPSFSSYHTLSLSLTHISQQRKRKWQALLHSLSSPFSSLS